MGHSPTLLELLTSANRVLIELSAIDTKARTTATSPAIRECLRVYTDLLIYQATVSLPECDSESLCAIVARMKTRLTYFGEDV